MKKTENMQNKALVYDDQCPLCVWYTGIFVQNGILPKEGRIPWSTLPTEAKTLVDSNRARNEIALIDRTGGKTLYGIDSLFLIIGNYFPPLKVLFRFPPFRFLMKQLYSLISYNRRIISGKSQCANEFACEPDFHPGWRWALVFISVLIAVPAALGLGNLNPGLIHSNALLMISISAGLSFLFSSFLLNRRLQLDYLGHLSAILIVAAFFLFIGNIILALTGNPLWLVFPAMFSYWVCSNMYLQRMKVLGLGAAWEFNWIISTVLVPALSNLVFKWI